MLLKRIISSSREADRGGTKGSIVGSQRNGAQNLALIILYVLGGGAFQTTLSWAQAKLSAALTPALYIWHMNADVLGTFSGTLLQMRRAR